MEMMIRIPFSKDEINYQADNKIRYVYTLAFNYRPVLAISP